MLYLIAKNPGYFPDFLIYIRADEGLLFEDLS